MKKKEKKQHKSFQMPTKKQMQHKARMAYRNRALYLMILPAFVSIFIFSYIPMPGIIIAFKDYSFKKGVFGSDWVGLKYFEKFITDLEFWRALKNTLKISVLKLGFCFPVPIFFALLLNELKSEKFKKVVQFCTYLPNFISWVVMVYILRALLTPYGGIFNDIRNMLGMESINVLGMKSTFYPLLVITDIWKGVGWHSIIFLAALNGIDQELYEAATVDGANRLQKTWHITLPGLVPTIVLLFIMQMGDLLSVNFDQVLLLQQPGNMELSQVLQTYTLKTGIQMGNFEYATAIGLATSFVGFVMTYVTNKVSKKVSDISLW